MASTIKWEKEQRTVTFFPLFPNRLYEAFPQAGVRTPRNAFLPLMWSATFHITHKTEGAISAINLYTYVVVQFHRNSYRTEED
jgi:hypothetical protein